MKLINALVLTLVLTSCGPIRGPQGNRGPVGATGATGAQGQPGQDGLNGADGQDAAQATVVQLCPGVSTRTTLIEVGICLQGQLYGVYSSRGGFLTLLSPGTYHSSAVRSACNFTVQPGCVVTH